MPDPVTGTGGTGSTSANNAAANDPNPVPTIDVKYGSFTTAKTDGSLFNPFYFVKYSGNTPGTTKALYYKNMAANPGAVDPGNASVGVRISNPTAANIIAWSKENLWGSPDRLTFAPYTWTDFIFCKYYGIIPNNRLVTLRKYPIGVDDRAGVGTPNTNNIPVAQAITWFGDVSGNDINELWQNSWTMAWTPKSTETVQNVQGNEIVNFSQAIGNLLSGSDTTSGIGKLVSTVATLVDYEAYAKKSTERQNIRAELLRNVGSGTIQEKVNELRRGAYSDNGALWNQIQGPVNVTTDFLIRGRGLSKEAISKEYKLKFVYRTDSYFGLSQRRVALDIIANMMKLTYSDGEWLANINAYYERVGIKLAADEQALFESALNDGNVNPEKLVEAMVLTAKARITTAISTAKSLAGDTLKLAAESSEFIKNFIQGEPSVEGFAALDKKFSGEKGQRKLETLLEIGIMTSLAGAFPDFIQKRAAVHNIATGNWHLTIGNPMNPIMKIGNLACQSCKCTFNDELGPDDFPTEITFEVSLKPMMPRDGRGVRRIFNIGKEDYIDGVLGNTSDQVNTYGNSYAALANISVGAKPQTKNNNSKAGQTAKGGHGRTVPKNTVEHIHSWINQMYGKGVDDKNILNEKTKERLAAVYFVKLNPTGDAPAGTNIQTSGGGN